MFGKNMKKFIIDGFNLAYRANFAFQDLKTSAGLPSGCAFFFLTTLRSLKKRFPDFKFYIAWDNDATVKKSLYTEYKANRVPFRLDFPIKDLKDALKKLNILQAEAPGQEADDVMASLTKSPVPGEDLIYIYSSDKDLLQLVEDGHVVVISPKVGPKEEKSYDEEAVKIKYGVEPKDLVCYFAFRGDTVDNIPGVARVPSKVLASLSSKHKNPASIYENLINESLTAFQRQSILNSKNQVLINLSLVTLNKDILYDITVGESKPEEFQKFLDKYEIKSFSAESFVELFKTETAFLTREGPKLKAYSLFD